MCGEGVVSICVYVYLFLFFYLFYLSFYFLCVCESSSVFVCKRLTLHDSQVVWFFVCVLSLYVHLCVFARGCRCVCLLVCVSAYLCVYVCLFPLPLFTAFPHLSANLSSPGNNLPFFAEIFRASFHKVSLHFIFPTFLQASCISRIPPVSSSETKNVSPIPDIPFALPPNNSNARSRIFFSLSVITRQTWAFQRDDSCTWRSPCPCNSSTSASYSLFVSFVSRIPLHSCRSIFSLCVYSLCSFPLYVPLPYI